MLEELAQRGGGYPVLADIQGQAEQSSEQPDQTVHCRGVGHLGNLLMSLPTQKILWVNDSLIYSENSMLHLETVTLLLQAFYPSGQTF